jgi:hypothetical protein
MYKAVAVVGAFLFFLASLAQAQFLQMPQFGNGTYGNLSTFVQTDVNHDGKTDILAIVNNPSNVTATIAVLLGNGTGGFGTAITTAISGVDNPINAAVGDFNGDGFPDVAFLGSDHTTGQNAVAVMLGNGNGTFQAGKETLISSVTTASAGVCFFPTADFNDDGKLDLAYLATNGSTTAVNVLLGDGNGTFSTTPTSISVNSAVSCLVAGDFNNDKKIDIAASSNGAVFTLLGKGNGTFESPITAGTTGGIMIAAEMNADDNLDLVLELRSPSSIGVLLGDGTGHFPTKYVYSGFSNQTYQGFAVQDLNGDGHPDVAVLAVNFNNGAIVKTLLNNGAGALTAGKSYDADGTTSDLGLLAADLTTGGHIDLAFGNDEGGFTVLAGNGNGTFNGNLSSTAPGSGIIVGQFDTKPAPDLLLETPGKTAITVLGNGDGSFSAGVQSAGCGSTSLAVGDFNHDGISDIAGISTVGDVPVITVCLGKGNGAFTPLGNFDQGVAHYSVLQGLFSGNANIDLVASDEHGFSVLLNNGDGSFANGIPT